MTFFSLCTFDALPFCDDWEPWGHWEPEGRPARIPVGPDAETMIRHAFAPAQLAVGLLAIYFSAGTTSSITSILLAAVLVGKRSTGNTVHENKPIPHSLLPRGLHVILARTHLTAHVRRSVFPLFTARSRDLPYTRAASTVIEIRARGRHNLSRACAAVSCPSMAYAQNGPRIGF